ncbi:hypothetical protein [Dolichospermum phage Dfl-JY45]
MLSVVNDRAAAEAIAWLLAHTYIGGRHFRVDRCAGDFGILIWRDGRACQAWRTPGPDVLDALWSAAPVREIAHVRVGGRAWCIEREQHADSVHVYPLKDGPGPRRAQHGPRAFARALEAMRNVFGDILSGNAYLFLALAVLGLAIGIYAVFGVSDRYRDASKVAPNGIEQRAEPAR